jgi:hypothetical protein
MPASGGGPNAPTASRNNSALISDSAIAAAAMTHATSSSPCRHSHHVRIDIDAFLWSDVGRKRGRHALVEANVSAPIVGALVAAARLNRSTRDEASRGQGRIASIMPAMAASSCDGSNGRRRETCSACTA